MLDTWMDQTLTVYPLETSPREIIRSVADKGGGAHVDDKLNRTLRFTRTTGPSGVGVHILFTVAMGRCVQKIGRHFAQFFSELIPEHKIIQALSAKNLFSERWSNDRVFCQSISQAKPAWMTWSFILRYVSARCIWRASASLCCIDL